MSQLSHPEFSQAALSSGIPVIHYERLDSTNDEAARQLARGRNTPVWIIAGEQWKGRGRSGRSWFSPRGNLYASLLLLTPVPPATATQLSFVGALAAYDAIAELLPPSRRAGLQLKWPNDVMLNGAKAAGILLESVRAPEGRNLAVILGVGINLCKAPTEAGRPVATLGLGPGHAPRAFSALSRHMKQWLDRWREGRGFSAIREGWLARAFPIGEALSVNLNGARIHGRFVGLDERGALQIETSSGLATVTAGDVFSDSMR